MQIKNTYSCRQDLEATSFMYPVTLGGIARPVTSTMLG
jgi:hypothetical protein